MSVAGIPSRNGRPPLVTMFHDGKTIVLQGDFGWGQLTVAGRKLPDPKGRALALAILKVCAPAEAASLLTRFHWRMIVPLTAGLPFKLEDAALTEALAEMRGANKELENIRRAVDQERAPVASEIGLGLSPIENKG